MGIKLYGGAAPPIGPGAIDLRQGEAFTVVMLPRTIRSGLQDLTLRVGNRNCSRRPRAPSSAAVEDQVLPKPAAGELKISGSCFISFPWFCGQNLASRGKRLRRLALHSGPYALRCARRQGKRSIRDWTVRSPGVPPKLGETIAQRKGAPKRPPLHGGGGGENRGTMINPSRHNRGFFFIRDRSCAGLIGLGDRLRRRNLPNLHESAGEQRADMVENSCEPRLTRHLMKGAGSLGLGASQRW